MAESKRQKPEEEMAQPPLKKLRAQMLTVVVDCFRSSLQRPDRALEFEVPADERVSQLQSRVAERMGWQQRRVLMIGGVHDSTLCLDVKMSELPMLPRWRSQLRFVQAYHVG